MDPAFARVSVLGIRGALRHTPWAFSSAKNAGRVPIGVSPPYAVFFSASTSADAAPRVTALHLAVARCRDLAPARPDAAPGEGRDEPADERSLETVELVRSARHRRIGQPPRRLLNEAAEMNEPGLALALVRHAQHGCAVAIRNPRVGLAVDIVESARSPARRCGRWSAGVPI